MPITTLEYNPATHEAWSMLSTFGAVTALITFATMLSLLFRALVMKSRPRLLSLFCGGAALIGVGIIVIGEIGAHKSMEQVVAQNQDEVNELMINTLHQYQADAGRECMDKPNSIICGGSQTIPVTALPSNGYGATFLMEPYLETNDDNSAVIVNVNITGW